MLRKILSNFSLIFSVMLSKLRLRQKNGFLIKKNNIYIHIRFSLLAPTSLSIYICIHIYISILYTYIYIYIYTSYIYYINIYRLYIVIYISSKRHNVSSHYMDTFALLLQNLRTLVPRIMSHNILYIFIRYIYIICIPMYTYIYIQTNRQQC